MSKAVIKILFRLIIDKNSKRDFEKNIFNASYEEFLMKSQVYNPDEKFSTFTEMVKNDGRANSLHYKAGFGALNFIEDLNYIIPLLFDNAGNAVSFKTYEFKMMESHIADISQHVVSVSFYTDELMLHESFGDHLLLAYKLADGQESKSFLLKIQPRLSIFEYAAT